MISVCMATYNGEKYIYEQLRSILSQLDESDEVIVSDDGSEDATLDIITSIYDKRIKLIKNEGPHGFTPNFQNALDNARGDIIFLADQDDIWLPNKVSVTLNELTDNDLTISDCVTIDANGVVISGSRFNDFKIRGTRVEHLIKSRYLGCCLAFKRKMLECLLPFPNRYDLLEHDIWIVAVGLAFYRVKLIKQPLILYRRHGNNVSDGGFGQGYALSKKIEKRIYRLGQLLKVWIRLREKQ